jgi:hypothetical protein
MKHTKTSLIGLALAAGLLASPGGANAWVAAAGGYGRGAVAVGGYHPAYYHPPTGCYGCGAAAGAVVGMAVGAAVVSASQPKTVVVAQPAVVYAPPPGYYAPGNLPLGSQFAVLPPGSNSMVVNGVTLYQNGPTWYRPFYGSSGVYYEVVPAP